MRNIVRKAITHPALAVGSTLLWGVFELIALQRSLWATPSKRNELTRW